LVFSAIRRRKEIGEKEPHVKELHVLKVRKPVTETKTIMEEEKNGRLADSS
jgi:hypothetical protein